MKKSIEQAATLYAESQKEFDDLSKLELSNIRRDFINGAMSPEARDCWREQFDKENLKMYKSALKDSIRANKAINELMSSSNLSNLKNPE